MGRRSRFRKAGPREPNGRSLRGSLPADLNPAYAATHRLAVTDQAAAAAHLHHLSLITAHESGRLAGSTVAAVVDDGGVTRIVALAAGHRPIKGQRKELRGSTETVLATARATNAHRKANLSFPIGIAFEIGLFRQLRCRVCGVDQFSWHREDCAGCARPLDEHDKRLEREGKELLDAADIYAGLHRAVWGKLPQDIEEALLQRRNGAAGLAAIVENGRIHAPPPTASQFRQWVADNRPPSDAILDHTEYLERRLKLADRYAASREALSRAGLTALHIVENMVIDGIKPYFLRPGAARTMRNLEDRNALVVGLKALADHFGLTDKRRAG